MNILMIADNFPPNRNTASRRTDGLSSGLIKLGHSVTIISEKIQEHDSRFDKSFKYIPNDRLNLKLVNLNNVSASNLLIYRLLDLLNPIKRQRKLYNAWVNLELQDNKFDLIWATFPDHCSLAFGAYLSSKLGIPWVADFRDCYQDKLNIFQRILLPVRMRAIKNAISSTSIIISVDPNVSKHIKKIKTKKPIFLLENAFNKKDFLSRPIYKPKTKKINFVFTGTINTDDQSLFPLLDGLLRNKRLNNFKIKIDLFGDIPKKFIKKHKKHKLCSLIKFHGIISRKKALKYSMKADILLSSHLMGSKIYDYIGSQRPILMTKSDFGTAEKIIRGNGIGWAPHNKIEMDKAINEIFEMSENKKIPSIKSNISKKFEYKNSAIKLNNIFINLIKKNKLKS